VGTSDVTATRDHLWRGLTQLRSAATERITSEKIETSYVGLYGYDARIQQFFADVTTTIKTLDYEAYLALLRDTQACVLDMPPDAAGYPSAELGNLLRTVSGTHAATLSQYLSGAIAPCSSWLLKIIQAPDRDIVGHRVDLQDVRPPPLPPDVSELFSSPLPAPDIDPGPSDEFPPHW
jgi:hypothetical protein